MSVDGASNEASPSLFPPGSADENFRLLAEHASDVVFTSDADGRVVWIASSVTKVLGYSPSELVGTRMADLWRPEARDATEEDRQELYRGHVPAQESGYVFEMRTKSGGYRWMSGNAHPLLDAQGRPAGAVSGLRDVTDLVNATEQRQAVLDAMLDYHALVDVVRDESGAPVDFVIADVNDAACHRFGRTRAQLVGTSLLAMFPGPAGWRLRDVCERVVHTGRPVAIDHESVDSPTYGGPRWFDIRAVKVADQVSITTRDVTDDYTLRLRVEESEARYRLLAENATDVVVHVQDGAMVWLSPSIRDVLGWEPEDWVGRSTVEFVHDDDIEGITAAISALDRGETISHRVRMRAKTAEYHWVEGRGRPFIDRDGHQAGRITSFRVIDTEVEAQQALQDRATRDDLTGLLTRGEILDRLDAILSHAPRGGGLTGIAFCDIDDFKDVNDRYGHGAGDEALRLLAGRIRTTVRENDLVARFGGDEILVVLDGIHDEPSARAVAEKIRSAALIPIPILGGSFTVTLSIGITLADPGDTLDELIARADDAMYDAKNSGKNQVMTITARDK